MSKENVIDLQMVANEQANENVSDEVEIINRPWNYDHNTIDANNQHSHLLKH